MYSPLSDTADSFIVYMVFAKRLDSVIEHVIMLTFIEHVTLFDGHKEYLGSVLSIG